MDESLYQRIELVQFKIFTRADVASLRKNVQGDGWSPMVDVVSP